MVEGYFDKEEQHSRLIRLQTYCIVTAFGAKLQGGGKIMPEDLWKLKGDNKGDTGTIPAWAATSIELRREIIEKLKKQNDSARNNN